MGMTLLVGILLFLLFLFIKFITPIPPFEESEKGGLVVNFGFDEAGMGDNNSMQPVEANQKKIESVNSTDPPAGSEMLASDDPTTAAVPPVKNKNKEVKPEEPKPDQNLLNALDKVHSTTGSNTGDGNTNTPGNQGDPNGSLNSNVYSEFGGPGTGLTGKIKGFGRKMTGNVNIHDDSQETGIVAVEILVDKKGKIIKAEPVLIGSTTTSSLLWKKAKDGLLQQKLFNESASGEEARGTIYINFTVR